MLADLSHEVQMLRETCAASYAGEDVRAMHVQLATDKDDKIDALRTELASTRMACEDWIKIANSGANKLNAAVQERDREKRRLDWLKHGVKFMHEERARGHADLWTVYNEDWSKPISTGWTLRDAIDAAIISEQNRD